MIAAVASVAPICPTCTAPARLTNGAEVYPHYRRLHEKPIWICDACGGYVGCHPGGTVALGTPAGPQLRNARSKLHDALVDPLWRNADQLPDYQPEDERARATIRRTARVRVYEFLAAALGLSAEACHIGLFDLETCRRAWRALRGVTYAEIRAWAHERRSAA